MAYVSDDFTAVNLMYDSAGSLLARLQLHVVVRDAWSDYLRNCQLLKDCAACISWYVYWVIRKSVCT
jgi:hypothetical protein